MVDNMLCDIQNFFTRIYKGEGAAVLDMLPKNERQVMQKAFNYAAKRHKDQLRKGPLQRPYTDHLLMTWYLLRFSGGSLEQQQAAILHDIVEDCREKDESRLDVIKEITNIFGDHIGNLVDGLTLPFDNEDDANELKIISKMSREIKLIKASDNTANLWDSIFDRPEHWTDERYKYVLQFREAVNRKASDEGSKEDLIFRDFMKIAINQAKPKAVQKKVPRCPKPKL